MKPTSIPNPKEKIEELGRRIDRLHRSVLEPGVLRGLAADQVDAVAAPDAGARGAGARGPLSRRVGVVRTDALRRSRVRRQRANDGTGRTSVLAYILESTDGRTDVLLFSMT
ncbi:MAG TPA: hypothetical protein VEP46_06125 [Vicinamibacterales bacterium]|nr:hypothetical protein [Vicinamibacterales bacterium]